MIRLAVMSVIVLACGIAFAAGAAAEDADAAGVAEKMMIEVQGTAEAGDAAQAAETTAPGDTTEASETMEADTYPLQTCVVSGAKLGSMGEPVVYEYEGREVRFCCKVCIKAFEKDPDKYMEKLHTVGSDPADETGEP
jgi:YHS domain-containing protein